MIYKYHWTLGNKLPIFYKVGGFFLKLGCWRSTKKYKFLALCWQGINLYTILLLIVIIIVLTCDVIEYLAQDREHVQSIQVFDS